MCVIMLLLLLLLCVCVCVCVRVCAGAMSGIRWCLSIARQSRNRATMKTSLWQMSSKFIRIVYVLCIMSKYKYVCCVCVYILCD